MWKRDDRNDVVGIEIFGNENNEEEAFDEQQEFSIQISSTN